MAALNIIKRKTIYFKRSNLNGIILMIALLFSSNIMSNGLSNPYSKDNLEYPESQRLKVGVVGLVHTHVHWILGREDEGDIEIVGIVEPNRDLAKRYSEQHGYSMDIVFDSIEEMVDATGPEAVTAFNSIYDHLSVVQYCAPRGIHVMVEKPLAVSWAHARKMERLARKHDIHLLTNYETSWYGSNYEAFGMLQNDKIGSIQRIVFNTGHPGPVEIGCNPEFLEWLTDPIQNGGGALTDFGCYGANLSTWLLGGSHPETVSCITRQFKPELYPNVDDDATIILDYPSAQVVIQASWNWSHNRKEMEIYGKTGFIFCENGSRMKILLDEEKGSFGKDAQQLERGIHDPFALLHKVVHHDYQLPAFDPSTLENNMIVMQILEAAKASAQSNSVIVWEEFFE